MAQLLEQRCRRTSFGLQDFELSETLKRPRSKRLQRIALEVPSHVRMALLVLALATNLQGFQLGVRSKGILGQVGD